MKIACIAVPPPDECGDTPVTPPLPLGYLAAVLEQQRHIVRIYDLALARSTASAQTRMALAAFRPHMVVIAASHEAAASSALHLLPDSSASVVRLAADLREHPPALAAALALRRLESGPACRSGEESVIAVALKALESDLDSLPFPARHLLPIEQYPLCTASGELQTPVLLAQRSPSGATLPRSPQQVLAETQSIVREHGIRHFVFPQVPLEQHREWLLDLLYHLTSANLGPYWELHMHHHQLQLNWLPLFQRAGCEMICLELPAGAVLHTCEQRTAFTTLVQQIQQAGIRVRAQITLDAPPDQLTALIDVVATFNLDAVRLHVRRNQAQSLPSDTTTVAAVAELARTRYRARRDRQLFVERFGPRLGPMLWRVGLLGGTWHREATGGETSVLVS